MRNRNSRDAGENHIYPFIISNFALFAGIFFSLNSAPEAAILLYSIALNLFTNWLSFYFSKKKKLAHFSGYYNDLEIGIFCVAAVIPVLSMILPLLLLSDISLFILLLISWGLAPIVNKIILKKYNWENQAEKHLIAYRMNIDEKKESAFDDLKNFIDQSDKKKFAEYIEKSQLFDRRMEEYVKRNISK